MFLWGRCWNCGFVVSLWGWELLVEGAAEFVTRGGYVILCLFQTVMLVLEIEHYLRK